MGSSAYHSAEIRPYEEVCKACRCLGCKTGTGSEDGYQTYRVSFKRPDRQDSQLSEEARSDYIFQSQGTDGSSDTGCEGFEFDEVTKCRYQVPNSLYLRTFLIS